MSPSRCFPDVEIFPLRGNVDTRLAKLAAGAVTLIDEDRQWFKSIQGLDVSETSREAAFCAQSITGWTRKNVAIVTALQSERG